MKLQLTRLLSVRYRTHLLVLTMHFSKINTQVTEVGTNLTNNKQIASPQANQKFVKRTRHLFFLVVFFVSRRTACSLQVEETENEFRVEETAFSRTTKRKEQTVLLAFIRKERANKKHS